MLGFEPQLGMDLCFSVDGAERWFSPVAHPRFPSMIHSMEGAKAFVYRLCSVREKNSEYALKVMKPKHRDSSLVRICGFLDSLKSTPGLAVCERLCLTQERSAPTIRQFPALQYSILMPWVSGVSWFDAMSLGQLPRTGGVLSKDSCFKIAANLAKVLGGLESSGLAHCDLSASNLLFDPKTLRIELIDVEDLFAPGAPPPKSLPAGTPGYQHCTSSQGQWSADADRFAGAVLLSEILGWYDDTFRAESFGESFFDPQELQRDGSSRLAVLNQAICRHRPVFGELLARAWRSKTIPECPTLEEWMRAFDVSAQWKRLPGSLREVATAQVIWKSSSHQPAAIGLGAIPFWRTLPSFSENDALQPNVQWVQEATNPRTTSPIVRWDAGKNSGGES